MWYSILIHVVDCMLSAGLRSFQYTNSFQYKSFWYKQIDSLAKSKNQLDSSDNVAGMSDEEVDGIENRVYVDTIKSFCRLFVYLHLRPFPCTFCFKW